MQLRRGTLVALETDGVARGLASSAQARGRGPGGGAQAQPAASSQECWERMRPAGGAEREGEVRAVLRGLVSLASVCAPHGQDFGGQVMQAAQGHETALWRGPGGAGRRYSASWCWELGAAGGLRSASSARVAFETFLSKSFFFFNEQHAIFQEEHSIFIFF